MHSNIYSSSYYFRLLQINLGQKMKSPLHLVILAFLTLQVFQLCIADTSFVYAKCNAKCIPQGSPFWGNLGFTLYQLAENTPYIDGYHLKTQYGGGNSPAYGEASCENAASEEDCAQCLQYLSNQIWRICNDAIGAQVQLGVCCIRYEEYPF